MAVVICGPGIVTSGVRPQGAAAMPTKVNSRVSCCIFLALVQPSHVYSHRTQMNGRRNTATGQAGLWQSEGGGLVAVPDLEGGGQRGRAARGTEEGDEQAGRKDATGARSQ